MNDIRRADCWISFDVLWTNNTFFYIKFILKFCSKSSSSSWLCSGLRNNWTSYKWIDSHTVRNEIILAYSYKIQRHRKWKLIFIGSLRDTTLNEYESSVNSNTYNLLLICSKVLLFTPRLLNFEMTSFVLRLNVYNMQ